MVQQSANLPDRPEGVLRKYTGSNGMPIMSVKTPSCRSGSSPRACAAALASSAPRMYPEDGRLRPDCDPEYAFRMRSSKASDVMWSQGRTRVREAQSDATEEGRDNAGRLEHADVGRNG